MFCTHCGARIADAANFCGGCGAQVKRAAPPPQPATPAYNAPVPPAPSQYSAPAPPVVADYSAPAAYSSPAPAPQYSSPIPAPVDPAIAPHHVDSSSTVTPRGYVPPPVHKISQCPWCNATIDYSSLQLQEGALSNCPKCGATLDLPQMVGRSGWAQLPARKDMAKLQFGDSFCQIEGVYVPVADVNLAAGDSVYFSHHVLLWKDPHIQIEPMGLKGAWTRVFAGLPLIMTQARGPGHVAFSRDLPGELIPVPIQPGDSIDVREHMFLAATGHVAYDWFQTGVWFETSQGQDEREMHYPVGQFMDRFSTGNAPGLLLLHAGGNVFTRHLRPGETILVKPTALIFKDPSVHMHLHFERPNMQFMSWGNWGNRYLWLRMTGPGRVGIQSVFERIEGEARNISRFSNATEQRW